MGAFLQASGLSALYGAACALPGRTSRVASTLLLVVVNLLPLWQVLRGVWTAGDLLVLYWLENVVVGFWAVVRISTARGPDTGPGRLTLTVNGRPVDTNRPRGALAGFFVFHYGLFTLIHGVFTAVLAFWTGVSASIGTLAVMAAALFVSHAASAAIHWFAQGERAVTSPATAMMQPYGRIIVLQIVVIASFFVFVGGPGDLGGWMPIDDELAPAVLLVAIKTGVDVTAHLRSHRRGTQPT